MRRTLLLWDDLMLAHDAGPSHPERPDRLRAIREALTLDPIAGVEWRRPMPAPRQAVERLHARDYLDSIDRLRGRAAELDPDTSVSPRSVEAAFLAAGAGINTVDAVMRGDAANAFALVRPPGHHAEHARAMGFCLLANIAIAAQHAIVTHGLERILILDWDVHHGNGTQHAFESRADVLTIDLHQHPLWPGTGTLSETGVGAGAGRCVNLPLLAGCGDAEYALAFERIVIPVADAFEPQLVLISAGFDAHQRDPLGGMRLTTSGFEWMCRRAAEIADRHAGGRLILMLEGGYDLVALADSVRACVRVLAAAADPGTTLTPGPAHPAAAAVIAEVADVYRRWWPTAG